MFSLALILQDEAVEAAIDRDRIHLAPVARRAAVEARQATPRFAVVVAEALTHEVVHHDPAVAHKSTINKSKRPI